MIQVMGTQVYDLETARIGEGQVREILEGGRGVNEILEEDYGYSRDTVETVEDLLDNIDEESNVSPRPAYTRPVAAAMGNLSEGKQSYRPENLKTNPAAEEHKSERIHDQTLSRHFNVLLDFLDSRGIVDEMDGWDGLYRINDSRSAENVSVAAVTASEIYLARDAGELLGHTKYLEDVSRDIVDNPVYSRLRSERMEEIEPADFSQHGVSERCAESFRAMLSKLQLLENTPNSGVKGSGREFEIVGKVVRELDSQS